LNSGNNENEEAIADKWWPELKTRLETYKKDYVKLYINTIKQIVLREDTSRPFIPSSPTKGPETEKEGWIAKNISDTRFGDVHFYTNFGKAYVINAWNWTIYPSSKFTSEYGFIAYPSFESISTATNESDWTYPISDVIKHRQHYPNGEQHIENLIANYLKLPVSGGKDRFIDIIYLSQISQSMSTKTQTEFYRRNRDIDKKTGSGYTMGALYWMLKDIWPAPSRCSLDFDGKWKMLHYFAKNMFQNLLISPFEGNNQTLKIAVVRDDYRGLVKFDLSVRVYLWSSLKISFEDKSVVETQSFSSKVVYSKPIADIIREAKCENRNQCVIEVSIKNSEFGLSANNFFLLSELKNAVGLQKPKIEITKITTNSSAQNVFNINIETNAITPFVWLDSKQNSNIRGRFSDNGFFMFDTNREIQFYSSKPVSIDELKSKLTLRSLTDVLSE
jgi:beta-mannosidase